MQSKHTKYHFNFGVGGREGGNGENRDEIYEIEYIP